MYSRYCTRRAKLLSNNRQSSEVHISTQASGNVALLLTVVAIVLVACQGGQTAPPLATPPGIVTPTVATPTPTASAVTPVANGDVTVSQPLVGAEVKTPIKIEGTARVFEATVSFSLKNAQGQEIAKGYTTASAGAPEVGKYSTDINYKLTGAKQNGTVEVFSVSPRDGTIMNLVKIPVVLLPTP